MKNKKALIIIIVLIVVIGAGVGVWYFLFKDSSTAPSSGGSEGASSAGSGYQTIPVTAPASSYAPTLAGMRSRSWRSLRDGHTINANTDLVGVNGLTAIHKDSAWTGTIVNGGTQINWVKNNGEKEVWLS